MALSPVSPAGVITIAGDITPAGEWASDYGPTDVYLAEAVAPPALPPATPPLAWTFELVDLEGRALAAVPAKARKVTMVRDQPGAATFTLPPDVAGEFGAYLQPGAVDLVVRRNGDAIYRGPLGVGGGQLATGAVTFASVGMLQLLEDRLVPQGRELLALEQAQMAWQLIADTQLLPRGDLGITAGSLPDSVARSRTWDAATSVLRAITELAEADNGFDFEVTPDLAFNVWYPRMGVDHRGDPGGVRIETGRNVRDGRVTIDAGPGRLANEVTAASNHQVSVVAEDVESQLALRLRQRIIQVGDVDDAALMGDLARAELRRSSRPRPDLQLELIPGAPDASLDRIGLGDVVPVKVRRGWLAADGAYRVDAIDVTIPDGGGPEALTLTLTPEEAG